MTENHFQTTLAALVGQIETLPESEREAMTKLASETKARHESVKNTINELQDAIDHLRLSTKYLAFDLEATRRENAQLRALLAEKTSDEDFGGDDDFSN